VPFGKLKTGSVEGRKLSDHERVWPTLGNENGQAFPIANVNFLNVKGRFSALIFSASIS
jgi:hypothetical protein